MEISDQKTFLSITSLSLLPTGENKIVHTNKKMEMESMFETLIKGIQAANTNQNIFEVFNHLHSSRELFMFCKICVSVLFSPGVNTHCRELNYTL